MALAQIDADELRRGLSFASICAAITCGRAGADPPRRSDVGAELSRLVAGYVRMIVIMVPGITLARPL